jgi:hypothetical protein
MLVLPLLAFCPPLVAQTTLSLDATGSNVNYGDLDRLASLTLMPAVRFDGRSASGVLWGSGTWFEDDSWAVQGAGAASVFTSTTATWRGEFGGSAIGRAFSGDVQTGELLGVARLHLTSTRQGLWGGASGGRSWSVTEPRMVGVGELGAWIARGDALAVVRVLPTAVEGQQGYMDASTSIRWVPRGVQVDVAGGLRLQSSEVEGWIGGALVVHVVGPLHVIGSAGTFLPDPIQGLEGGDYVTLGLRLARRPPRELVSPVLTAEPPPEAAALKGFAMRRTAEGRVRMQLDAPTLQRVELLGDLTDWVPVPMLREGGSWIVEVDAPPGRYRMSFRVDGGTWVAPPGVPSESDDFGGTIGIVMVP